MRKFFLFFILLVIISYVTYSYFNYSKLFNYEHLRNASSEISVAVYNHVFQFGEENLTEVEAFDFMQNWVYANYSVFEKYDDILKYGYKIKLLDSDEYYFIISGDNEASDKDIFLTNEEEFNQNKPSFFKYLFTHFNGYNIALFGYKNTQNCFYSEVKDKEDIYSFFNGVEPVEAFQRKNMINSIELFKKQKLKLRTVDSLKKPEENIFFKIHSHNISLMCEAEKYDEQLKFIEKELRNYLDSLKVEIPERGVFSIQAASID